MKPARGKRTAGNTGDDARRKAGADRGGTQHRVPTQQDVRAKTEDDEPEEESARPEPLAAGTQAP
ncbi:hypothetical protein ACFCZY_32610 [Streptomyces sp. NPDC056237]|uniref:hypothetical protein n=1 Tax=unclassified Streptomyces TaxID=2593676 RepID=UPI0035D826D7